MKKLLLSALLLGLPLASHAEVTFDSSSCDMRSLGGCYLNQAGEKFDYDTRQVILTEFRTFTDGTTTLSHAWVGNLNPNHFISIALDSLKKHKLVSVKYSLAAEGEELQGCHMEISADTPAHQQLAIVKAGNQYYCKTR